MGIDEKAAWIVLTDVLNMTVLSASSHSGAARCSIAAPRRAGRKYLSNFMSISVNSCKKHLVLSAVS
jgi:hypothetical protein